MGLLAAQSDERLARLAREGHERAFEAVVQRYRRPLLRYCGRLGLSDSRAEDVLQHALLQAWLALEGGTEVRELRAWLYRIVHNAAVNAIRACSDDVALPQEGGRGEVSKAAEADVDHRMALRDALNDVAALPQMQREAILLTAVDGRSHEEVASALGA
jgi:RNA polymerase sigma factor (sigma-70 family)